MLTRSVTPYRSCALTWAALLLVAPAIAPAQPENGRPVATQRDGGCDPGGCTGATTPYPVLISSTPSNEWTTFVLCGFGGEHSRFAVVQGNTYEWSGCAGDGNAACPWDSQFVLRDTSGNNICYNDDWCATNGASRIRWTADFTGEVHLARFQYDCASNEICANFVWRMVDPCESILPDRFEENDTFDQAADLGMLGYREEPDLTIHAAGNDDYFAFRAVCDGTATVAIDFEHASGDVDLAIYDQNRNFIDRSASTTDDERLSFLVFAGLRYFVHVYGYEGTCHPNYTLTVDSPIGCDSCDEIAADRFEDNDTFVDATDLGLLGARTEAGLTIDMADDGDYYVFTASQTGRMTVEATFEHVRGDVDLYVYDNAEAEIASSRSTADNELVAFDATAGVRYYVLIHGYDGACSPSYDLVISSVACALAGHDDALWRLGNNYIAIEFSCPVGAPPSSGEILVQELLPEGGFGSNVADSFSITTADNMLFLQENGQVLSHRTWYAVRNTGDWSSSLPFDAHFVVQVGDANGDGRVLPNDLSLINSDIPNLSAPIDSRLDIQGDGRVLPNDLSIANTSIPSLDVPLPSGH